MPTPTAPQVSVLLPARNAGATLPACLDSLSRQTFRDWKLIAVDDGSTDATAAVLDAAARRDGRIHVRTLPRVGLVAALNEGLTLCRAPLIARMDADDVMHRRRLERQVSALRADPSLSAVGCHVRVFPRAALTPRRREYEAWLNSLATPGEVARDAFVECPVAHPSLVMRADMAALRYRDAGWPEDYDLVLRALAAGMRIGVVPARLLMWRDRHDRASRTDARYAQARFTACKAHFLASGFLHDTERYGLWGYGGTGRALRRALSSLGKHPAFIVEVKPSRVGERIHGAPVVPPDALRTLERRPLVVSVAFAGPRVEIRAALTAMGFAEGRDYVCAA